MNKIRRIAAWLTILLIAGLIIGTLICAIMGSTYFYGMLCLSLGVPVVLWVFIWFTHLVHGDSKVISKEVSEALNHSKQTSEFTDQKKE